MTPQTILRLQLCWKVPSTAVQLYLASLIASAGSASEPWLNLITIAHMGAAIATLRGIDALFDMTFGRIVHNSGEAEKARIAADTETPPVTTPPAPATPAP